MYSKAKVITGLVIFVLFAGFPFWKNLAGSPESLPELKIPAEAGDHCVEDRDFMRQKHMKLLDNWRNEVVRENKKVYTNAKGEHFNKSLTNTCLNCHQDREEFCDTCHAAADVKTYCFDCHLSSEYPKEGAFHENK